MNVMYEIRGIGRTIEFQGILDIIGMFAVY